MQNRAIFQKPCRISANIKRQVIQTYLHNTQLQIPVRYSSVCQPAALTSVLRHLCMEVSLTSMYKRASAAAATFNAPSLTTHFFWGVIYVPISPLLNLSHSIKAI